MGRIGWMCDSHCLLVERKNLMGNLSKNFSRWEFECKCNCVFNSVDPRLVEALQCLRDLLGVPININSACRCEVYNRKKGGKKDSQHLMGRAADIWCKGIKPRKIAEIAEQIPEFRKGGIGIYRTFVHIDARINGPARWGKKIKKRRKIKTLVKENRDPTPEEWAALDAVTKTNHNRIQNS